MMVRSGKLRHKVTIESVQYTQNPETGGMAPEWVEFAKAWASVEPLSVRDFMQSGAGQSEVTARITIRYREGLDSTMRIRHRGKIYNIVGVLPDNASGLEHITLPVKEGVNDGE